VKQNDEAVERGADPVQLIRDRDQILMQHPASSCSYSCVLASQT
jgi:hypothetical protein